MGDSKATNSHTTSTSNTENVEEIDQISYVTTAILKPPKKTKVINEDEPLVDTTKSIPKKSKKTERARRQLEKRERKALSRTKPTSLLDLPPELLQDILGYLRPSDVFRLQGLNRPVRDFIQENENSIARDINRRRYWVLSRCFPIPEALENVEISAHAALLSNRRQEMLQIHKKPYQHVKGVDPLDVCTCMNCVFAWNNLCLLLDLNHWQKYLDNREPIPMIPRGSSPAWNSKLLGANAAVVEKAMHGHLLQYSYILEKHLKTTMATLSRTYRGKKTVHPKRLYHFTNADAEKETDEFLERNGPHSYEFPWHRDNYYALEAYVPNRKWSKDRERWVYYAKDQHQRDVEWVKERFTPAEQESHAACKNITAGGRELSRPVDVK